MRGFIFLLLFSFATSLSASKVISNTNKATRISWEQQILLQKIMKSYMKMGADIDASKELKRLDASIALYEENIDLLEDLIIDTKIQELLNTINLHWYKFRLLAISPPNRFDALALLYRGEKLEELGTKIYQELEKDNSFLNKSEEFQTYSKLLELSYELSMYYYAQIWDIEKEASASNIKLKLPKRYISKRKKIEGILKKDDWLKDVDVYSQNIYSVLKSYYIIPKKRLKELDNSQKTKAAFYILETNFANLAEKSTKSLLEKNGYDN